MRDSHTSTDSLMADLQQRVRDRLRRDLRRHGASEALEDPAILAHVAELLTRAEAAAKPGALMLPELLGDPDAWRLDTAMRYRSHRTSLQAALIVGLKRRLLM